MTREEILAVLRNLDRDYGPLLERGDDVLPVLREILLGGETSDAVVVPQVAALLGSTGGHRLIAEASGHPSYRVRLSAAHAAARLPGEVAEEILTRLLGDGHDDVVLQALRTAADTALERLRPLAERLATGQAAWHVRQQAQGLLRLPPPEGIAMVLEDRL